MSRRYLRNQGFSLVEMAMVLLIVGLLAKSAVGPLAAVQEHGRRQQATRQLQEVHQALIAHLVAFGALPCPSRSARQGSATLSASISTPPSAKRMEICTVGDGWVDARKLRIGGALNASSALLDPWGREYRYVVSLESHAHYGKPEFPDWTTSGEATDVGIENLSSRLVLCSTLASGQCARTSVRADQIAFIVFSTAGDSSVKGLQKENLDGDNVFISAEESIIDGAEYDDLMVWASTADVSYWMLRMGWLP